MRQHNLTPQYSHSLEEEKMHQYRQNARPAESRVVLWPLVHGDGAAPCVCVPTLWSPCSSCRMRAIIPASYSHRVGAEAAKGPSPRTHVRAISDLFFSCNVMRATPIQKETQKRLVPQPVDWASFGYDGAPCFVREEKSARDQGCHGQNNSGSRVVGAPTESCRRLVAGRSEKLPVPLDYRMSSSRVVIVESATSPASCGVILSSSIKERGCFMEGVCERFHHVGWAHHAMAGQNKQPKPKSMRFCCIAHMYVSPQIKLPIEEATRARLCLAVKICPCFKLANHASAGPRERAAARFWSWLMRDVRESSWVRIRRHLIPHALTTLTAQHCSVVFYLAGQDNCHAELRRGRVWPGDRVAV